MTSPDCIDSLHRAMSSTFNADYLTKATKVETLVKHDVAESKKCIKRIDKGKRMHVNEDKINTASCVKKQELKKPLKSEEHPPAHNEPSLELLLNSMSNTFDSECATCTDEADSLLNHDLAEDKTMKWRNLFNNKFAYKENITHKRVIRVKKQVNSMQQSLSYITSNEKKHKKDVELLKKSEKKLNKKRKIVGRTSAKALGDDDDCQQRNETKESAFTPNEILETQLAVCKEELNVSDDDNLPLATAVNELPACRKRGRNRNDNSNGLSVKQRWLQSEDKAKDHCAKTQLIKIETIKHDIEDIYDSSEAAELKQNHSKLTEKDHSPLTRGLVIDVHNNSDLGKGRGGRTRKIKCEVDKTIAKKHFADKNNRKKRLGNKCIHRKGHES